MIGGNATMILETRTATEDPETGVQGETWAEAARLRGYIDLIDGTSTRAPNMAKIQESTHIFLAGYQALDFGASQVRAAVGGKAYDVQLIDNPMGLCRQLEIYLRYTGP